MIHSAFCLRSTKINSWLYVNSKYLDMMFEFVLTLKNPLCFGPQCSKHTYGTLGKWLNLEGYELINNVMIYRVITLLECMEPCRSWTQLEEGHWWPALKDHILFQDSASCSLLVGIRERSNWPSPHGRLVPWALAWWRNNGAQWLWDFRKSELRQTFPPLFLVCSVRHTNSASHISDG